MSVNHSRPITLCLLAATCVSVQGCGRKSPSSNRPTMTPAHQAALAHIAKATSYSAKDHYKAVAEAELAVQIEPSDPEWKQDLAFELHRAGRTSEAVPLWRELAKTNDDQGRLAAKWLKKVGAKP